MFHFTEEKQTELHRGWMTCPAPQCWGGPGMRFELTYAYLGTLFLTILLLQNPLKPLKKNYSMKKTFTVLFSNRLTEKKSTLQKDMFSIHSIFVKWTKSIYAYSKREKWLETCQHANSGYLGVVGLCVLNFLFVCVFYVL